MSRKKSLIQVRHVWCDSWRFFFPPILEFKAVLGFFSIPRTRHYLNDFVFPSTVISLTILLSSHEMATHPLNFLCMLNFVYLFSKVPPNKMLGHFTLHWTSVLKCWKRMEKLWNTHVWIYLIASAQGVCIIR